MCVGPVLGAWLLLLSFDITRKTVASFPPSRSECAQAPSSTVNNLQPHHTPAPHTRTGMANSERKRGVEWAVIRAKI